MHGREKKKSYSTSTSSSLSGTEKEKEPLKISQIKPLKSFQIELKKKKQHRKKPLDESSSQGNHKSEVPYKKLANIMKIKIQINSSGKSKEKRQVRREVPVPSRRKSKESLEISNKQQPEKSIIAPPLESISLEDREFYSPLGNFEWHLLQSDDDIGDYSIYLDDHVTRIRRTNLEAFFAERKERNQLRKQKGLQPKKPAKGHWFCVYQVTGDSDDKPCTMCLKTDHFQGLCPYRHYVSKDAKIGPGGVLVCKCCREEGGHYGTDWIACVTDNICMICRNAGEHGTEECPKKMTKY